VLCVEVGSEGADDALLARLVRLSSAAAGLLAAKNAYGDILVRLRRRSPLGLAAEMQYAILPPLTFAGRQVSVSAALEPCYEVAGDTIDYAVDDGRTRVAIFDGMGHGMHSAQCAVFTVVAYRNARRRGLTLTETLHSIDEALNTGLGGEVFTTAVLADLDTRTGLLQWVNAGHPAPLLIRGGKLIRKLETEPQPPLGLGHLLPDQPLEPAQEQLEPADLVLLYTDGVVEARSPDGEFFGVERLAELVVRHLAGGLTAPETMRRVVGELLTHHGGQLTDDATLLMLEWRSTRTAQPGVADDTAPVSASSERAAEEPARH
jgi:serine phosphatase RsbU (regulator of sigma subunit)